MNARTVFSVLEETVAQQGAAAALHQPKGGGKYTIYSWMDYRTAVIEIAVGLADLGVAHGDIVAIQSETRAEFTWRTWRSCPWGRSRRASMRVIPRLTK